MSLRLSVATVVTCFLVYETTLFGACGELFDGDENGQKEQVSVSSFVGQNEQALAAYEPNAWLELMQIMSQNGDKKASFSNSLLPLIVDMPSSLSRTLDPYLQELYILAATGFHPEVEDGSVLYQPVEAAAAFMHGSFDTYETIRSLRDSGSALEEAYRITLALFRARFLSGRDQFHYSPEVVLETAKKLQLILRRVVVQSDIAADRAELTMFGSFVNGRAHVEHSKVNVSVNSADLGIELGPYYQKIRSFINRRIKNGQLSLAVQVDGLSSAKLSPISPIQFRVTVRKIEMLVFPRVVVSSAAQMVPGSGRVNVQPLVWEF